MLDRNTLASSPIQKKKNVAQESVTEFVVDRSCSGTVDFPFQKSRSDKKNMLQKRLDFGAIQQSSEPRRTPGRILVHSTNTSTKYATQIQYLYYK